MRTPRPIIALSAACTILFSAGLTYVVWDITAGDARRAELRRRWDAVSEALEVQRAASDAARRSVGPAATTLANPSPAELQRTATENARRRVEFDVRIAEIHRLAAEQSAASQATLEAYGSIPPGIVAMFLWPLAAAAFAPLYYRQLAARRRERWRRTGRCRECGYDLRGIPTRCSECGSPPLVATAPAADLAR